MPHDIEFGERSRNGNTSVSVLVVSLQGGCDVEESRMAQPARQHQTLSEQDEKRIAEEAKAIQKQDTEPERRGDVLGLSDVTSGGDLQSDDLGPAAARRDLND